MHISTPDTRRILDDFSPLAVSDALRPPGSARRHLDEETATEFRVALIRELDGVGRPGVAPEHRLEYQAARRDFLERLEAAHPEAHAIVMEELRQPGGWNFGSPEHNFLLGVTKAFADFITDGELYKRQREIDAREARPVLGEHEVVVAIAPAGSLGGMIDTLAGIVPNPTATIRLGEIGYGEYRVLDHGGPAGFSFSFARWPQDATDVDGVGCDEDGEPCWNSDAKSCFGYSDHLRRGGVELTPSIMRGPSIEAVRSALQGIVCVHFDPRDI